MTYAADILVILASLGAMAYCMVLSRRLSRLTSFDKGLGSAIAVMSSQVDEMKAALREAKAGSDGAGHQLGALVGQAREISSELELMIAACHDFAEEAIAVQVPEPVVQAAAPVDPEDHWADDYKDQSRLPSSTDARDPDEKAILPFEEAPSGTVEGAEVTPMFGSRRAAAADRTIEPPSEPVFRHRRSAMVQ